MGCGLSAFKHCAFPVSIPILLPLRAPFLLLLVFPACFCFLLPSILLSDWGEVYLFSILQEESKFTQGSHIHEGLTRKGKQILWVLPKKEEDGKELSVLS